MGETDWIFTNQNLTIRTHTFVFRIIKLISSNAIVLYVQFQKFLLIFGLWQICRSFVLFFPYNRNRNQNARIKSNLNNPKLSMRKSDYDCGQLLLDLNWNRLYTGEEKNIIKMTVISTFPCPIAQFRVIVNWLFFMSNIALATEMACLIFIIIATLRSSAAFDLISWRSALIEQKQQTDTTNDNGK